jgi:S-adenosylmethionine:tRNA ribosyltransferase-isomerase
LNVADFDFELPGDRIAQEPLPERDASRLMQLDRATGAVRHRAFRDLPDLLEPGDLVVLNDTRVIPARLMGRKATGGAVEVLLLEPVERPGAVAWRCLVRGSKSLRPGAPIDLGGGLSGEIVTKDDEACVVRFLADERTFDRAVEALGQVPLPPYIHREPGDSRQEEDRRRYQTVFARVPGAVAAPTAGLHFTPAILERLAGRGIETARVTLHTGEATFLPVRTEKVEDHRLYPERFEIPEEAAEAIGRARDRGGRVVAVGTTVVRTLEASALPGRRVRAASGRSDLFLYPGYEFRVVDALVTNFHLPRSTLLMLVSAFAGRENVLAAYREAVRSGYRFFSYGDAMLIG